MFKFKKFFNLRFIIWALFNKNKFREMNDYRIVLSRFIDINSNIMMIMLGSIMLNRFV